MTSVNLSDKYALATPISGGNFRVWKTFKNIKRLELAYKFTINSLAETGSDNPFIPLELDTVHNVGNVIQALVDKYKA